jgi:hypothetical protein
MTEDDLKRLKHLPVPPPAEGAREAAVAAALAAFEPAAAPRTDAPQGSDVPPRLRGTSAISEGSRKMRFRRPVAMAASIAVLALAVPVTALLMLTPRVADQVARPDRLAFSEPAHKPALPAREPPAPPPPHADVDRRGDGGDATSSRPAATTGAVPDEKSTACPSGTLCLPLFPKQAKQKAAEVLAKRKVVDPIEMAPTTRAAPAPPPPTAQIVTRPN